jgi:hypothetical protein
MATSYTKAGKDIHAEVEAIAHEYNPPLAEAGVTILVLWADGGLEVRGHAAAASARILNARDRAAGMPDCCITLCRETWDGLSEAKRRALIDHEANHFLPQRDKNDPAKWALDDNLRPKLKMRRHDAEIGFFFDVVERHGKDAMESGSFLDLHKTFTQMAFPWG